jgi:hypothetical protein
MAPVGRKTTHHCPGPKIGGSIRGKNCTTTKGAGFCREHQELCPMHPEWTKMKGKPCIICEKEEQVEAKKAKKAKETKKKDTAKAKDDAWYKGQ